MADNDRSIATVLSDIVGDIAEIVRAEVRLAKVEIREEVAGAKRGALFLIVGGVAFVMAVGLVLLSAVYALAMIWPPWAAALAVAAVMVVAGLVLSAAGRKQLKDITIAPPKTVASLKENVQWAKTRAK